MERASLRPVPQRPSGPVEPDEAIAHVATTLPALDEVATRALALVELVGRDRPQLHAEMGIAPEELSETLARARKALRRASFALPGSGWCERAERLLSDELDGELADPGPRRLAAHLANCDRCVEHERRLWQARDQLVVRFDEARAPAPLPEPPAVVDEPDPEPVELPDPDPPAAEAPKTIATPELRLVEPAAETVPPSTPEPADPVPAAPPPAEPPPVEPEPVEEPPPAAESRSFTLAGVAWAASIGFAVLLAVISIALTVYAIAGGGF